MTTYANRFVLIVTLMAVMIMLGMPYDVWRLG